MSQAACETWPGNDIPTFRNNKDNTAKLNELVNKLEPECALPDFGRAAIKQHILDCLTERRRNVKKGYDYENVSLKLGYIHVLTWP